MFKQAAAIVLTVLWITLEVPAAFSAVRNLQDNFQLVYHVLDVSGNHVTGQTVTLQIKKTSTGDWFDFSDSTFKAAGWTSKTTNLAEDAINGFYYYTFNPPASETAAEEYQFLIDNADATYGDHQSETVQYQQIGTSTFTAASEQVTVATNNDKTGYSLTQTFPSNFSSLAITGAGKVTVGTNDDKTGYAISGTKTTLDSLQDLSAQNVWEYVTRTLTSGGSSLTAEDVWTYATRTITGGGYTGLTAADIDLIWDELLAGHAVSGSAGAAMTSLLQSTNGAKDGGAYNGIENLIRQHGN